MLSAVNELAFMDVPGPGVILSGADFQAERHDLQRTERNHQKRAIIKRYGSAKVPLAAVPFARSLSNPGF